MRFGRRRRDPATEAGVSPASVPAPPDLTLSVCVVGPRSPERAAATLLPLRELATQTVIALEASQVADRSAYEALADVVVLAGAGHATPLDAARAAATQRAVLWLDRDESVTPALLAQLPSLLRTADPRRFAVLRRWLTPAGDGWLDEEPWSSDWQVRVSVAADDDAPLEHVEGAPIDFARLSATTPADRRRDVVRREIVELGGPGTMRSTRVRIEDPDRYATRAPAPLDRVAPAPATSRVEQDPGEAAFTLLDGDLGFTEGEARTVTVRLTNTSAERWQPGTEIGAPGIAASYRWHAPDGTVAEGARTLLPAPIDAGASAVVPITAIGPAAGEWTLEFAIIDEGVRWLTGTARVAATVAGPESWPTARELRPAAAGTSPIPRVIHRIWLGDAPLPEGYRAYGETWAAHHPGWELKLWTEADAPVPAGAGRARNFAERADLVRYEILRQHGGIYVDTDVECLRPIDDLLDGVVAFAGYEVPGRCCNAVMGAVPGHPAITELTELAAVAVGHGTFPEATATTFATYVLEAHPDVTLFSPDRFYPTLWDGTASVPGVDRSEGLSESTYANHDWAMSWSSA